MTGPSSTSRVVRFGVFEANFSAQELCKHGTRVRLRGQSFALLEMLVERSGEIVTRDEMRKTLWPADTFVDFENGLNAAIRKLRAVLGDTPENPRYIETVPRTGYRFIAPLRGIAPAVVELRRTTDRKPANPEPAPPVPVPGDKRRAVWPLMVAGIVLSAGLIAGVLLAARPRPTPRLLGGVKLTNSARADAYGRVLTDGARLFFLERHGHRWVLMQIPASGGEPQPFANPFENTRLLAVSPDASEVIVAPFKQRDELLPLWLMPSVGGVTARLGEVTAFDAVFAPEGRAITYSTGEGIFQVGRDGLKPKQLVKMNGWLLGLAWSPDAKVLRFEARTADGGSSRIWEVRHDGSGLREVLPDWGQDTWQANGRWTADGRYFLFTGARPGKAEAIWVIPEGRGLLGRHRETAQPLTSGPVGMDQALPSQDGKRLFALGAADRREYARFDEKTGVQGLLAGAGAAAAAYAPDGSWMAYTQDGGLWRGRPDGGDRKLLAPEALSPAIPAVSPDGKLVAFQGHPEGTAVYRLYVVPAEGGAPREVVNEKHSAHAAVWSGRGSALALTYCLQNDGGNCGVLRRTNLATGASEDIPGSQRLWKNKWSPDGRYMAASGDDLKRLALYDTRTKKWAELEKVNIISPLAWTHDSKVLVYQDLGEENQPVRRMPIIDGKQGGPVKRVEACKALLEGGVQRCGFEGLTPDGGYLLRLTRGDRDVYSLEVELP